MAYVTTRATAVTVLHRITDLQGSLVTSSLTGLSATLYDQTQNSEPTLVTWSEPVTGGYLNITVTPDTVGNWLLRFTNPTTGSDGATDDYYIQTVANAAGLTPAERSSQT